MSAYKPFEYQINKVKKETPNQVKKHVSQFSETEFHILHAFVNGICGSKLQITPHAKSHISFINQSIVQQTLDDCELIEFNITNQNPRLLIRSRKQLNVVIDGNLDIAHVCMVIDIKNLRVITSYANTCSDNHQTLNWDRYDPDLDILKYAM